MEQSYSQIVRQHACDWVLANLYSSATNHAVFEQIFERLAEILAVMNMANEGTQLDLVDIVLGHPSFRASQSSRNFDSYLRWLKSGKTPSSPSLLEFEAFVQLHIVLKYGSKLEKAFCFKCLHSAQETLKSLKTVSSQWGLGLVFYLQSRVNIQHPGPQTTFVIEQLLTKSEKALLIVTRQLKTQKIDGLSDTFRFRHYYIACVFSLHNKVENAMYCLVKAKNQQALPALQEILSNPDFDQIKHNYTDFEYVLKEPSQYTKERFAYESERRKYIKKQGFLLDGPSNQTAMSASSLLTESSLFRDAMSKSTLEILSGGKLELMVNLKAFFEPVRSNETTAAHARLKERMELYGYEARREIPGDGNCQMYSLSDQLTGNIRHAAHIRRVLVRWLRTHSDVPLQNGSTIKDFIYDKKFEDYCSEMATDRTWGDHLTLIAAAEVFCARVVVISSIPGDNFIIEINPTLGFEAVTLENSTIGSVPEPNLIALSHFAEFHYGSVHPILSDLP